MGDKSGSPSKPAYFVIRILPAVFLRIEADGETRRRFGRATD